MIHDEIKEATQTVKWLICRHMPSAAIASGWVSPVDATAFIRELRKEWIKEEMREYCKREHATT